MKHPFIILGTVGATLMLGGAVWAYLFLFYEPAPESARVAENPFVEVDANEFGAIGGEGADSEDALEPESVSAGVAITERRVAGAVALTDGTYRIIEAGTGHAYEVGVGSVERKISNTTLPQTIAAVWAPSGERVVLTRESEGAFRTFIVTLGAGEEGAESEELGDVAENIAWSDDSSTLMYTRATQIGSEGVALDVAEDTETVVFKTPLRDITVEWGPEPLIVTKATREHLGYAYRSDSSRTTDGMVALTAVQENGLTLFSSIAGNSLVSWFAQGANTVALERGVVPEKCAILSSGALCAMPKRFDITTYPDSWYRGEETYDDEVLYIDGGTGAIKPLGDLAISFRAPLDIVRTDPAPGGALMLSKDGHLVFVAYAE